MMHGRAVIVGGCPVTDREDFYHALITEASFVVAADAGLDLCLLTGRMPDICVGDFDSTDPVLLTRAAEAGSLIERHPADKDMSDLDLALGALREHRGSVVITAAFSGRLDHTLASLGTLMRAADTGGVGMDPGVVIYPLDAQCRPRICLRLANGTLFSVMTVAGSATVSISGARYPLSEAPIALMSSRGLSNAACGPEQVVTVHSGQVLLFVVSDSPRPGCSAAKF